MGLRCTHLVSTKKEDVDFFGLKRPISASASTTSTTHHLPRTTETDADGHEWQVWPEDEFETAAREEREEEFHQLERLSQEYEYNVSHSNNDNSSKIDQTSTRSQQKASEEADRRVRREKQTDIPAYPKKEYRGGSDTTPSSSSSSKRGQGSENSDIWHCPICSRPQAASDREFNEHVDYCLSRGTIREAVEREGTTNEESGKDDEDAEN
ncbi:MAG: hypothetical protein Q9199_005794, partial [Rusavskia elegans]